MSVESIVLEERLWELVSRDGSTSGQLLRPEDSRVVVPMKKMEYGVLIVMMAIVDGGSD
jgi:hypothetical protein